ncbi:MAG: guanylate kinase [Nitrospiraceae bacterium]|nr:guanylate kinase [Nitrospiraceae bacterium]
MQKKNRGGIFIVSAPSGAGKTTLCGKLLAKDETVRPSVSYTTRLPRPGEIDGRDYSFVTERVFRAMVKRGEFVEWAEVHGNLYGTSKKRLQGLMRSGFDVILDIDVQGARQIRESLDGCVFIFILPPSMKTLRERIEKRKSNTRADIERRLRRAATEIREYKLYDYVIVNDTLKLALKSLEAVFAAERLGTQRMDARWIKENFLS